MKELDCKKGGPKNHKAGSIPNGIDLNWTSIDEAGNRFLIHNQWTNSHRSRERKPPRTREKRK